MRNYILFSLIIGSISLSTTLHGMLSSGIRIVAPITTKRLMHTARPHALLSHREHVAFHNTKNRPKNARRFTIPIYYFPRRDQQHGAIPTITNVADLCELLKCRNREKTSVVLKKYGLLGQTFAEIAREIMAPDLLVEITSKERGNATNNTQSHQLESGSTGTGNEYLALASITSLLLARKNLDAHMICVQSVREETDEGGFNYYDEILVDIAAASSPEAHRSLERGISLVSIGNPLS